MERRRRRSSSRCGSSPASRPIGRPVPMRIGLSPYGTGAHKRWLVDYWMPATNYAGRPYNGDGIGRP